MTMDIGRFAQRAMATLGATHPYPIARFRG